MLFWMVSTYLYPITQTYAAMSLQNELDAFTRLVQNETPPRLLSVLERFTDALREQNASARSLQVGDTVANVTLNLPRHRPVDLYTLLNEGPVVLSFCRGGWCPYCNLELKALHHAQPEIKRRGAQLIVITPERPENIAQTVRKNRLDYPVVHDVNSEVARQFGLAVSLSEPIKALYRSLGLNLAARNADVLIRLPLPATYVINTDYRVHYAFVNEDYTQRAEPAEVLASLHSIVPELVQSYG